MSKPYIYERQSEYWTSRQIEEFFLDAGYELLTFPINPHLEKRIPADFIYFDKNTCKLFGIQYKALYGNGEDYWPVALPQHKVLSKFPWIYYCLSEMKSHRDQRAALHLAKFIQSDSIPLEKEKILRFDESPIYRRWGSFYQGLQSCKVGIRITDINQFKEVINPSNTNLPFSIEELGVDLFLSDITSRHTVHYASHLKRE